MITKHHDPQNGSSKGISTLLLAAGGWPAGKTCEDAVRSSVDELHLPTVPIPVQSIEMLYNSVAEPDRELLKLPIRGYVQAKSASQLQWRKWIGAAALEWEKIQG